MWFSLLIHAANMIVEPAGVCQVARLHSGEAWPLEYCKIDTPFYYSKCACVHPQHSSCPHMMWWPTSFYFCLSYNQFIWNCLLFPVPHTVSAQTLPFSSNGCYSMLSSFLLQIHHFLLPKRCSWAYPKCSYWDYPLLCVPPTAPAFLLGPHCPHIWFRALVPADKASFLKYIVEY